MHGLRTQANNMVRGHVGVGAGRVGSASTAEWWGMSTSSRVTIGKMTCVKRNVVLGQGVSITSPGQGCSRGVQVVGEIPVYGAHFCE